VKILCILLPHVPLKCETVRNPGLADCRVVVLHGAGSRKAVLDYSPDIDGVQKDMTLQQALARDSEVELVQADLPVYWSAFNSVLDVLEFSVSPLVEGPELGTAYLDIGGLHLIYPDDESIIRAVRDVIPAAFGTQMGIAGGKFPAYIAALNSPLNGYKALSGDLGFMSDLSCDVLPVPMKHKTMLREFGIHTLGQLAVFPAGPLQSQFGSEGVKIRELARGFDDTPLYPRDTRDVIEENTMLPSVATSIDTVLAVVETLVSRVFGKISLKGLGIHNLALWTRSYDSEYWERTIRFKDPAMDMKSAVSRIRRVLENYPQPGPVEQAGIRVTRLGYPRGRQNSLFTEIRGRNHLMEDIRQLELRQGNPQVFRIKEVEPWSRIPERRYALIPTGR
jgi:DNA polymerase-4/protein ImuB